MQDFDIDSLRKRMAKKTGSGAGGQRTAEDMQVWEQFKAQSAFAAPRLFSTLIKVQLSIVGRYVLVDEQSQQVRCFRFRSSRSCRCTHRIRGTESFRMMFRFSRRSCESWASQSIASTSRC